ncbi:MAG: hypothetical protein U0T84_12110 [Chitinophagales bacterium]
MRQLFFLLLLPALLPAQTPKTVTEKPRPKWVVQAGFCLPEFYNLGYEINGSYFPLSKKHIRIGPSLQFNNFYIVQKNWFNSNNIEKATSAEVRLNALLNVEIIPFKKNTFYLGVAPYVGYQMLNNRGTVKNEVNQINLKWNYLLQNYDFGLRVKLGGYVDKQKRFGLESAFQFSARGAADDNPDTKIFNIGLPSYKAYVSVGATYRIQ